MALRMRIVSDNAAKAGEHPHWTFGVNGGRIGRNESNDWVLRDTNRFVSGRHAEIEHRAGAWWLRDISTNGTFVNEADEALGRDQTYQLVSGDRIRIGEYDIAVEISGSNDFPADESLTITDPDASFEVKSFVSTERRERDRRSRPERAAAPAGTPAPTATSWARDEQELWPGIVALCKGAGIDARALPPEVRVAALQHAGQLFRETLVGFTELARTRADFASQFGVASGARQRDATNPLLQVAAVEQLLEMLLSGQGPGDTGAIDEIRTQFARARHHETAVAAALREGLAAVFKKLDPDELEEQLGRRAGGAAQGDLQARLWNRYRELFTATVQSSEVGLPAVFLAAFARAYEAIVAGGEVGDSGQRDD